MESLLQGLNGVSIYLDDFLVTGSTHENHLHNLAAVLEQIEQAGLRLNRSKCFFLQPRLEYLGHVIDEAGRHPTEDKIRAIKEAPAPTNITELRSFLGVITYYRGLHLLNSSWDDDFALAWICFFLQFHRKLRVSN